MSITLYFNPYSSRCLAVKTILLLTKSEFTETVIDIFKGDNQKAAFTNLNPNQTVPAITEGFFSLFESHAIIKYICLLKEDFILYPNDLQNRALVNSYLDWHENEFTKILNFSKECYFKPILIGNSVPENRVMLLVDVEEVLQFFVKVFLKNGEYKYIFNQSQPTIADFIATCDLSSLFICNFDFDKFPILEQYIDRMFKIPQIYLSHKELFLLIQKQKYQNQFIQSILTQQPRIEQIILYTHPLSAPSRAVRALLSMGKIEFDEKIIDILKSENLSEKFTKINPNQTIPFIKQGQYVLFESHAIMKYICDQYKLQELYPQQNLKLKSQIDSYLDFHHNEMKIISQYVMQQKNNVIDSQQEIDNLLIFFVRVFLNEGKNKYIFNNKCISIADLSAFNEILSLVIVNYDFNKIPQIQKYISNILDNQIIKLTCKEYFSSLSSNQMQLNQYNKQLITSSKKKGCC